MGPISTFIKNKYTVPPLHFFKMIVGHSISKTVANTYKTLSILLMRGNSEILLNRSPRTLFPPPPPDDYEMSSQDG